MIGIGQRADLHAATAAGAEVIIDVKGILNDHGAKSVRRFFDRFHSGLGQGGYERMPGDPQIKGTKLKVEVFRPFRKMAMSSGELQKMQSPGHPNQRQTGLRQILSNLQGAIPGADNKNGLLTGRSRRGA